MDEFALAMRSIVLPLAQILCTVRPHLLAFTVAEPSNPLSVVSRARFKHVFWSCLPLSVRVKYCFGQCFLLVRYREIPAVSTLGHSDLRDLLPRAVASPDRLHLDDVLQMRCEFTQRHRALYSKLL